MTILNMPTIPFLLVLALTHFLVGWVAYWVAYSMCGG